MENTQKHRMHTALPIILKLCRKYIQQERKKKNCPIHHSVCVSLGQLAPSCCDDQLYL